MAYTANTPLAGDRISDTQPIINANFVGLGTMTNPDEGLIKFPFQGADPTIPAANVGLFCKVGATSGLKELWFKRDVGVSVPISESVRSGVTFDYTPPGGVVNTVTGGGWYYLPSGAIVKYGINKVVGTEGDINLNDVGFGPTFTAVLSSQITAVGNAAPLNSSCITGLAMFILSYATKYATAPSTTAYFTVIGY